MPTVRLFTYNTAKGYGFITHENNGTVAKTFKESPLSILIFLNYLILGCQPKFELDAFLNVFATGPYLHP